MSTHQVHLFTRVQRQKLADDMRVRTANPNISSPGHIVRLNWKHTYSIFNNDRLSTEKPLKFGQIAPPLKCLVWSTKDVTDSFNSLVTRVHFVHSTTLCFNFVRQRGSNIIRFIIF